MTAVTGGDEPVTPEPEPPEEVETENPPYDTAELQYSKQYTIIKDAVVNNVQKSTFYTAPKSGTATPIKKSSGVSKFSSGSAHYTVHFKFPRKTYEYYNSMYVAANVKYDGGIMYKLRVALEYSDGSIEYVEQDSDSVTEDPSGSPMVEGHKLVSKHFYPDKLGKTLINVYPGLINSTAGFTNISFELRNVKKKS